MISLGYEGSTRQTQHLIQLCGTVVHEPFVNRAMFKAMARDFYHTSSMKSKHTFLPPKKHWNKTHLRKRNIKTDTLSMTATQIGNK